MEELLNLVILLGVGSIFGVIVGFYIVINKKLEKRRKNKMYKK